MNQQLVRVLLASIGLAGLVLSGYLTVFSSTDSTGCDLNALFSCSEVLTSKYSQFMGVPVAALGLIWFAGATVLSFASFTASIKRMTFLSWAFVGVLGIPPLVYGEFLVGSICLLCTSAHILGLTFLGLSLFLLR